jgi:hypothetical protein
MKKLVKRFKKDWTVRRNHEWMVEENLHFFGNGAGWLLQQDMRASMKRP